jgi:hypothetical protein
LGSGGDLPEQRCGHPPRRTILLDMHDEWVAAERRYLSEGSMAQLYTTGDELVAALVLGA